MVSSLSLNGFAQPVLRSARTTLSVEVGSSLRKSAETIRQNGTSDIPVVEAGRLVGIINSSSLRMALASDMDLDASVDDWMVPAETIGAHETGATALRRLEERNDSHLWVIDERQTLMGVVHVADLFPRRRPMPRPAAIGGMATPFGVYLTTGSLSSGPRKWALVTTGTCMIIILLCGQALGLWADGNAAQLHLPKFVAENLGTALTLLVFMIGFRSTPLAAIHAAEHQTVHAIERGEELSLEVVRRMPRVHPRCGTNIFAGATIFLTVFGFEWIPSVELRLIAASLLTVVFWRRLGAIIQQWITTRPANDRYLAMGIQSGKELLNRYGETPITTPTWPQRIWNSGMLHTMVGGWLGIAIAYGFQLVTKINVGIDASDFRF
jgi:CBS domain-containing protein